MRAEKSANLIFNGGKKSKPAKEAEVSIFFSNTKNEFPIKCKEVKLTRIVRKNGTSIYKINGETRTRQQIVDLLSAARINAEGHNIVLQGDIVRFMQMKNEERREIIEEIAGISIYEEKKGQAMKELSHVQEKLNEADIILTEREKTLSDLKKDRNQAIKFKEIEKNIKRNKATRLNLLIKKKEEKKKEIESKRDQIEKDIQQLQDKIDSLKKGIGATGDAIKKINSELEEKGDKRQRNLSKEIDELKTEVIKKSSRKDVVVNEIRRIKERKKGMTSSIKEIKQTLQNLEKKKKHLKNNKKNEEKNESEINSKIKAFKKKHGIKDMGDYTKSISMFDNQIENTQKDFNSLLTKKQEIIRRNDKIGFQLKSLNEKISNTQSLRKEDVERLQQLKFKKNEFKKITKSLSSALNESSVFSVQLSEARNKLMDARDEHARLRARDIGIKEFVAGDQALKKIASMNIPGVYGTVSELGKVNSKYALALEVAAGSRIKSVVVNNDSTAAKCIKILKEGRSGVVTFLPLNKLKERTINNQAINFSKKPGAKGLAIDLVSCEAKFKSVFKYVFGPTVVVDDLPTARMLGIGNARMVTLEGELLEISGAMIGGYRRKKVGMGFKEKEIESGLHNLEKDMDILTKKVNLLEEKKTANEESIMNLRERKAILEAAIISSEEKTPNTGDLNELKKEQQGLISAIKSLKTELEKTDKGIKLAETDIAGFKAKKNEIKIRMNLLTSSALNSKLEQLEEKKQSLRESIIKNESQAANIEQQKSMHYNEIHKTESIINNLESELEDFHLELIETTTLIEKQKAGLKEKEKEQRKFYSEYQHLFAKRNKLNNVIQKIETAIIKNEERIRGFETRKNDFSVRAAIINGELEGYYKEFEEFKDIQLRRGISLEDLNIEIKSNEKSLRNMGNVNLRALEIYEKVQKKYVSLTEKYEKLKLEKEDVLKMMYEIESKKKGIFMKTFKAIDEHFKQIFASLSNKGEAILTIENPENPFEGGVDIQVRLVGNKFLDIKGLSGGEKTMAALAFIFAIQNFEPAHFYIMDEVDAALDKNNSEVLSKLIAKYARHAQYIVISHNDAIISEADTIFGVSMQEDISKVISLRI